MTTLLAATALLYVVGLVRLWTTAGRSKGIRAWQVLAFAGGWTALVIAQREVLMIIAAPLLVLGRPLIALLWLMPSRWRFPIAQAAQSSTAAPSALYSRFRRICGIRSAR